VATNSDHYDLLLFALQQDMRAALRYQQAKRSALTDGNITMNFYVFIHSPLANRLFFPLAPIYYLFASLGYLHIPKDAFEARVTKELAVPHQSLVSFYSSAALARAGYVLNQDLPLVILYPIPTE
jgi:hypothetical protein